MKDRGHEYVPAYFANRAAGDFSSDRGLHPFATAGTRKDPANANTPPRALAPVMMPKRPASATKAISYRVLGKRLLDIALVLITLPVILPIGLLCALALWVQGGSPLHRQDCLGKDGEIFSLLKLRTLVRTADERLVAQMAHVPGQLGDWDGYQTLKNDPRVTRFGAILRASSLDELPQLWNVLIGDMSLVGPRPMLPEQLPLYGNAQAYFPLRPGLTGNWRIAPCTDVHFANRAKNDAEYNAEVSFWGDLVLMIKTVVTALRSTGF